MGMFDEKRYLTGKNGVVAPGDAFHLHGAGIAGTVRKQGTNDTTPEAFLLISKSGAEEPIRVFTTGAAIVGQLQRMDNADQTRMAHGGMAVRLGVLPVTDPSKNPAFILEDATAPSGEDTSTTVPDQTPGQAF